MSFYIQINEKTIPPYTVVYMRRTGAYGDANRKLMNTIKRWLVEKRLYHAKTIIWAIPLDDPRVIESSLCRYDVCANISTNEDFGGEILKREIRGGKYLVFLIEHTAASITAAWQKCFDETIRQNRILDPNRLVMECYRKELVDRHLCELYVPIL